MKLIGWMLSAGLAATATATLAQPLPLPPRGPVPPAIEVSDFGSPDIAMPAPPLLRRTMPEIGIAGELLAPDEIVAIARDEGFTPLGMPRQRGPLYTLAAINPDGDDGRLVIDGRSGALLRFMPAWQMGDAMEQVTVASYGRIHGLPRISERNPPRPPRAVGHLATRTPAATPLPRPAPPQPAGAKAATGASDAAAAAGKPVQDAAKPNPDKPKPPGGAQDTAAVQATPAAAATAAKPAFATRPTEPMPPVQGLE